MLLDRSPDGTLTHVAAAWAERVTGVRDVQVVHGLQDANGDLTTPTGVLARPDGVVARAADTAGPAAVTGLEAALHRWAGTPPTPEHSGTRQGCRM